MVPSADGAAVGCITITAASPAAFGIGWPTDATPGTPRTVAATAAASGTRSRSTAISMVPFAPGPYSAATRSYARRVVFDSGWLPASCGQVRIARAGAASTPSATTESTTDRTGREVTRRAQRSVRVGACSRGGTAAGALRTLRGRIRRPARPHSAGTSVTDASMTAPTVANVA